MRRFLVLLIFLAKRNPVQAQSSFSFNCVKDTSISCAIPCITLHTTLPDIYSSTASYTVNPVCFKPYISPAAPGPSANLTIDDRYSPLIDITFPFSFYGKTYTKLAASTNGFLTFDNSKASTFSHYGILANGSLLSSTTGIPQDLPSSLYDGAIIMGPYHDLDPNNATSALQMKYDVIGTAPYRKWILSYYKVPLYTTACLNLATNTHQIVLYETLGIVEVFIYDKEICLNWNNGRSMIGMQDMSKSLAITAPARSASSAPWGSQAMNESWRFVPATGTSLFKKVELYTLSGSFVSVGNTSNAGNNLLNVSFNNICPPAGGETYIVKSFYNNPDGSAGEIIGADTINVSRGVPVTANISFTKCSGGNNGSIVVSSPTGANYEYSIDGINWQTSNLFVVPEGTYIVRARVAGSTCISSKIFSVGRNPLDASITVFPTSCSGPPTGGIRANPVNGTPPYIYSLNNTAFQGTNFFTDLPTGTYTIYVRDAMGCMFTTTAFVPLFGPEFTTTVKNTLCGAVSSGSISVTVTSGTAPFSYSLDNGPFQTSNVFQNLPMGTYNITVKDATSCFTTARLDVRNDFSFTAAMVLQMPGCFGNSDGSIIINPIGNSIFQYALNGNAFQTNNRFDNLKAGQYILQIKDSIGCTKDSAITLLQPNPLIISAITTSATSCTTPDAELTIKANGGTTPYEYSIDDGKTFTLNNFFKTTSGTFSLVVKDMKGCITKGTATVVALKNDLTLDLGPDKTICYGDTIIPVPTITPSGDYFRWSPGKNVSDTTAVSPKISPDDTTKYFLTVRAGYCEREDSVTISVRHKPVANAGTDTLICYNTAATLHGSATNLSGGVKYLWTPSADVITPDSAISIVRPKNNGPGIYRLQVSDTYGCNFKVYDQVVVTMNARVPAFAGNDTVASIGMPLQLSGSGGTKYLWSPPSVLDNPLLQNPIAILQNDTKFNLLVKDTLGCSGTSSVSIKVYKGTSYYIPNAFTPNNDGINDLFRAVAPGVQKTYYFRIYNRLGQMLFQTQDARKGWDGTFAGIAQPTAVYVWLIKGLDATGKLIELRGTVTLIR